MQKATDLPRPRRRDYIESRPGWFLAADFSGTKLRGPAGGGRTDPRSCLPGAARATTGMVECQGKGVS